jgi:hypothetical protein
LYTQVTAGDLFACALDHHGFAECWGFDSGGQTTPPHIPFVQISAGGGNACGLERDGTILCWGPFAERER